MFMGPSARRIVKPPPKKKGFKKKTRSSDVGDAEARAEPRASEPSLGSTLHSNERDTHAYMASPVTAAAAESFSSPQPINDAVVDSLIPHSDGHSGEISRAGDARSAAATLPLLPVQNDTARLRASTINVIEQAALSGIEECDSRLDPEERISAVVKRAQAAISPGKKGGHSLVDDTAAHASGQSSQKPHMLSYLQRCTLFVSSRCNPPF